MLELDVTLQASVDACIQTVLTRSDTIDVLVNNAGQTHASLVEDTLIETALRVFDTNFWGVVRVTNAVLPTMRKQRSGLIINVSSLAGLVGVRAKDSTPRVNTHWRDTLKRFKANFSSSTSGYRSSSRGSSERTCITPCYA